ncbi:MAG: DUF2703 domain-containing protein [Methanobacterium sp.]|nr:DUF2703 domain-containing protein [Methanobacterium sp.]
MESNEMTGMKTLKIKWQRLISDEQTCPRCGSTEGELEKAVLTLKQSLTPLGIEVILKKKALSEEEFKRDPLKSNQILLNDRPLEDWIRGEVGQSECCDVCNDDCRTIEVEGEVYETIPAELIIKAGLLAATQLVDKTEPSCGCEIPGEPDDSCCPK